VLLDVDQTLVETAMLSAVSGLAFLLSTLLKLDNSLGYFLPLPIAIAACRSGVGAAWHTMMATAFLLLGGFYNCYDCYDHHASTGDGNQCANVQPVVRLLSACFPIVLC
jgi:hypothetical protein